MQPIQIDGSEHYLAVTLPSREDPRYAETVALLKATGFVLEPSNRKWWLRDRHKTLCFLAAHATRLRGEGAVFTENFQARTRHLVEPEVAVSAAPSGADWDVEIALNAAGAPEGTLRDAILANRPYVESAGRVVLLNPDRLQDLARAQAALREEYPLGVSARARGRVSPVRLHEVQQAIESVSPSYAPPEAWRDRTAALRDLSRLRPAPCQPEILNLLRPYQRIGVAWLWHLHTNGLGGVLADEMGLGKTLQALALFSAVAETRGRCLVVCPASLVENWRREAARFAPWLVTRVHHGPDRKADPGSEPWDLLITSYGILSRDQNVLSPLPLTCAAADEAQHVKNARTQNAQALRALRAGSRFLLTGTPVENSLDDLRSLFDFALPGYLERLPRAPRGEERAWADERLRVRTAPYILRRTKAAVAPELPEKIEQVLWCPMEGAQEAFYRQQQEQSEREMIDLEASGASEGRLRFAALTQLLRLRQICCDARLVPGGKADVGSSKREALLELIDEARDGDHRILIFSQFATMLGLLREEVDNLGIEACHLDGSMAPAARQAEVDRFQRPDGPPVFLISLKAGGTGLNLTAADTVVHFDPWWNPAAEAQATDRAHRLGQTRVVTAYKLACPGTVEERVLALQEEKRALLAGVFEASEEAASRLSLADLKSLLRPD